MSRGQGARHDRLKSIWILALCVGLIIAGWPTGASVAAAASPGLGVGRASRPWENYFGVALLQADRAVVVGDKGVVMTSANRGSTWTRIQLKKDDKYYDLYSVAFAPDGSSGWAVGDGGAIFHTGDSGATWTLQKSGGSTALLKIAVIDSQKACVAGEHGLILCTVDGGANWVATKFEDLVFFDIAFTDPNHGWAVGEFSTIVRTIDGGKTWTVQVGGKRLVTLDPYFALDFKDAENGMVLGLNGIYMATSDGGNTWKAGKLPNQNHSFYAEVAAPVDGSVAYYAGGENGMTGRIVDEKVIRTATATSNSITSIAFKSNFGLAVGLSGTVMRSEDGGQTWTQLQGSRLVETLAK